MSNINNSRMRMSENAYATIKNTVGMYPAETGALLFGSRDDYIIQKVVFDTSGNKGSAHYSPDIQFCNSVIKEMYEEGLEFLGMVHSHPYGLSQLSGEYGDIGYIRKIFQAMPSLDRILVPIVFSSADGPNFQLFCYQSDRDSPSKYYKVDLEVISESEEVNDKGLLDTSRLAGAISVDVMESNHITFVGVGGAQNIATNLARCGVIGFTLIDFDTVSHSNLCTQGFAKADVGLFKVDVVKREILKINPKAKVEVRKVDFTLINKRSLTMLAKKTDLWMLMCDQFAPHKLAYELISKHPKPAIYAGMYWKSMGAEVIFTIPEGQGYTAHDYKDIVAKRFEYFENGGTVPETLIGTSIFHTYYLNSVIGIQALSILHRNESPEDYFMGGWFSDKCDHNLIQFRLHPEYSSKEGNLFARTFPKTRAGISGAYAYDAIWQYVGEDEPVPQEA